MRLIRTRRQLGVDLGAYNTRIDFVDVFPEVSFDPHFAPPFPPRLRL